MTTIQKNKVLSSSLVKLNYPKLFFKALIHFFNKKTSLKHKVDFKENLKKI